MPQLLLRIGFVALVFMLSGRHVAAQSCYALINAVYAQAALECDSLAVGQACYASAPVTTPGLTDEGFSRPGDRMTGVQALQTGAFDLGAGEWGLALMRAATNQPDVILTLIMLGDVLLGNASTESAPIVTVPVRVTFPRGSFLRAAPAEDAVQVMPLVAGQVVAATGRLIDGRWFRLLLEDGRSGWVRADVIAVDGDYTLLPVVTAEDPSPVSLFGPLQSFDFASGYENPVCSDVPFSGILLQVDGETTVRVNGAQVDFGGTVFLQAYTGRELIVNVLEETATVNVAGRSVTAGVGQRIRVPYVAGDEQLAAPRDPQPYIYTRMATLPLALLPRPVVDLPINLTDVVEPMVSGRVVLEGVMAESRCTVEAGNEVRLRGGPGREYAVIGAMYPGERAYPTAMTTGTDGATWWRLTAGVWVNADVIYAGGACTGHLPVIETLTDDAESAENDG